MENKNALNLEELFLIDFSLADKIENLKRKIEVEKILTYNESVITGEIFRLQNQLKQYEEVQRKILHMEYERSLIEMPPEK